MLRDKPKGIYAIYITPLRALNRDIFKRMSELCKRFNFSLKVRHGDTPERERSEIISAPPNILITTPETLDALIVMEKFNMHLNEVKFLIIDEAHELLEARRGAHLYMLINRIKHFNKSFRIIGLSATLEDPFWFAKFLYGNEPFRVLKDESERYYDVEIRYSKGLRDFSLKVKEILEEFKSSLIFANTRSLAELLGYHLSKNGLEVEIHHGSLGRELREEIESRLKQGKLKAVVATSSLEHGIDLPSVEIVIQFGSPIQARILKQRVGRSMHRFGEKARGIIFVDNIIEAIESSILVKNSNINKLEAHSIVHQPLDILAHHLIGLLLIKDELELEKIYEEVKKTALYENLSREKFEELISFLSSMRLVFVREGKLYPIRARCIPYYFNTISTIFEEPLYSCIDAVTRKQIGKVDGKFLFEAKEEDSSLVLAGRAWKVLSIDEEKGIAELLPLEESSNFPVWLGEMLPVSKEVAEEVFDLLGSLIKGKTSNFNARFSEEIQSFMNEFINNARLNLAYLPSSKILVFERFEDFIFIINPRGTRINRGIAILLKGILGEKLERCEANAYAIICHLRENIPLSLFIKFFLRIPEILKDREFLSRLLFDNYSFLSILKQVSVFLGIFKKDSIEEISFKKLKSLKGTLAEEEAIKWFLHNYADYDGMMNLFENINISEIKPLCFELRNPSPLASIFLGTSILFKEVQYEKIPNFSIYEAVEKRLLDEEMLFLCFACKYEFKTKVGFLSENIICPKCKSIKIAIINPYDEGLMKAKEAFKSSNMKMLKKFSKDFDRIRLSSELTARFGKNAAIAMAGRGIGPETARRILINWNGNKNDLIKEIIRQEIKYATTRKYWSD